MPVPTATTKTTTAAQVTKYRRARRLNVVLGVVAVFLGVVVAAQSLQGQSPAAAPAQPDRTGEHDFVRRDADDPMAIGAVDAPVVLTQWTDLRCPYCALFARKTLPTLIQEYVDTGKVRIEFHDVAFFGEHSEDAAVAARAAAAQGKFMEFITAVYAAAPERGHPDLPRETLITFAEKAGVPDMARFTADLDDPAIRDAAQASTREAQQIGVNSVPFFVAGDTALAGSQPIETFRELIDTAAAKTE
ncbi:thioredoxin domain-containing protein [Nocardia sp. NPDC050193]